MAHEQFIIDCIITDSVANHKWLRKHSLVLRFYHFQTCLSGALIVSFAIKSNKKLSFLDRNSNSQQGANFVGGLA